MTKEFKQAYKAFINAWGVEAQSLMAIEEMSELTKAICKLRRCKSHGGDEKSALENLKEEIADVLNVAEQLECVYGIEEIENLRKQKIARTLKKLEEGKCRK